MLLPVENYGMVMAPNSRLDFLKRKKGAQNVHQELKILMKKLYGLSFLITLVSSFLNFLLVRVFMFIIFLCAFFSIVYTSFLQCGMLLSYYISFCSIIFLFYCILVFSSLQLFPPSVLYYINSNFCLYLLLCVILTLLNFHTLFVYVIYK